MDGYVCDVSNGYPYCRSGSKIRENLERELLIYSGKDQDFQTEAVVFPSGMNAIICAMEVVLKEWKDSTMVPHFVLGNELYCDVRRTVEYLKETNTFTVEYVDVKQTENIKKIFETNKRIALFFIETCTNPSGQMFDFDIMPTLKTLAPRCIMCVDNTWVSFCWFNPFQYQADLVIESLTKYGSGGKCISGMIIGKNPMIGKIREWVCVYGQFLTPLQCDLLMNGLKTICSRIEKSSPLVLPVAQWLETIPQVSRVLHPSLKSHPTYKTNLKYLHNKNPAVIVFHLEVTINKTNNNPKTYLKDILMNGIKGIKLETSYGSSYSKICPWASFGKSNKYDYGNNNDTFELKTGIWLRLSIGYNDNFESIQQNLKEIISHIV